MRTQLFYSLLKGTSFLNSTTTLFHFRCPPLPNPSNGESAENINTMYPKTRDKITQENMLLGLAFNNFHVIAKLL